VFWQHFHRHIPLQPPVPRPIHFPHATRSKRRNHFVRSKSGSHRERHFTILLKTKPFSASPKNEIGENGADLSAEVECCSFSCRIPGVVDSVSTIFKPAEMPGLETIEVRDEDAIQTTRQLIARGFPVGPSSGLNFFAAQTVVRRLGPAARVVTVFADRMERYFTTELFAPYR